jgi:hypothetical protein
MTALLLHGDGTGPIALRRRSFASGDAATTIAADGAPLPVSITAAVSTSPPSWSRATDVARYDERWLQETLFQHPELIPLDRMEPGAGAVVPLCREFSLPREAGAVFLDLLGVSRAGRLVLVECKLWRNPQARREVVAQILEYAALMRGWSYGDLGARLRQRGGWSGGNAIFERARSVWPDLDEAAFVDGVARSLATGDFHLVIAGDGIRSDLQAIAAHLGRDGGGLARLALLEIQLWSDGTGRTVIMPQVPLRTEVIQRRVFVSEAGQPLRVAEPVSTADESGEVVERLVDPDLAARRAQNRQFWQRFIDEVSFDHPDQPPARHGGNNWVRIPLPAPVGWLTVYRSASELGLFVRLSGEDGAALHAGLAEALPAIDAESGLALTATVGRAEPFEGTIGAVWARAEFAGETAELALLKAAANRLVTALRPRIKTLVETIE